MLPVQTSGIALSVLRNDGDCCSLNCAHCGSSCSAGKRTRLDVDVIRKVMRSVAGRYEPNDTMVRLTGGEPLLHPGLYEVIREAKGLGFAVRMTTNGTPINAQAARALLRSGLDIMAVSLDWIGETHDIFRGRKGSFEQALCGIREMKMSASIRKS